MYSPKIREDLVPRIYQTAKATGLPMTTWVNRVLEEALPEAGTPEQPQTRKDTERYDSNRN